MFLKRVEIVGFKSFAERIGIDFVPGVTAIVGPNGSGKSNVTDAIRWVLGEQSAKSLRGSKMEDVIFAGSDSRKPLNFAEVTLILDNSNGLFPLDYTEISVSRRVFRSGESAYLLNGQQCRLKDINDVFMDSGLGKEAFSIISQGRVDEILNSRPEDRRSIFDEAAGVLKYKTRKRKAEHKLFETEDNLDRVLDILKELDGRIGPLQKNAEAAERHQYLSEKVRDADVRLLNFDGNRLRRELLIKSEEYEKQETEADQLQEKIVAAEKTAAKIRNEMLQADEKIETLQKKLLDISTEIEKWEGRRLLSLEKKKNTEQHAVRIANELKQAAEEKETLVQKLAEAKENRETAAEELSAVQAQMNEITNILKRSVKETEEEIEDLKSAYIDLLNEEASCRSDLRHINERMDTEKTSADRMAEQSVRLSEKLKQLKKDRQQKQIEFDSYENKRKTLAASYEQSERLARDVQQELSEQQKLMQAALTKQSEAKGRLRALQSMEDDFSGFYSGVKAVLLAKKEGKLSGIDGAVAELISVDGKYVKAVETALGGAMQHVVTATEREARTAIAHLKQRNAGRATFLPRDVIKPKKMSSSVIRTAETHAEYIGTGDSLVTVDPMYAAIAENLLALTLVAETLSGATAIAKLTGYRYRIVTLDGDVVNAGGSLTGGGAKGQSTVFSRKAEVEKLKSYVSKMEKSIEIGTEKISDTKMTAARHMHQADQYRTQLTELSEKIAAAESAVRETDIEIRTAEMELSVAVRGKDSGRSAGSELEERKRKLLSAHESIKEKTASLQKEIETLERLAADRRTEEAALQSTLGELREKAAVLREQKLYYETAERQLNTQIETLENRMAAFLEEQKFYAEEQGSGSLSTEEITDRLKKAVEEKEQAEQALSIKRKTRAEWTASSAAVEGELSNSRRQHAKKNEALNDMKVAISRIEMRYESIAGRLLNEYGLYPDFDAADEFDVEAARSEVSGLKAELEQIGSVNPASIEEYKEVAGRHAFLTEQRNDLMEAKSTLHEAMNEMDREMETRFGTTFTAVRNRFCHVFKEMFGGGEADLILTEPDNLLTTGVDIVARPPGKKLQNLSLLSGGERALTAITLLFSIIEVRPVPFCILDEVEAALDEANVIRYSKYLKKFSNQTQFIVITHRKGTMEGADVLYGITMMESGVSKLISVKLSEVPEKVLT